MIGKVRSRDAGEVIDYIISYFEFNVRPASLQRLPLEGFLEFRNVCGPVVCDHPAGKLLHTV